MITSSTIEPLFHILYWQRISLTKVLDVIDNHFLLIPVSCVIWEGDECQKVDLTALHISWVIIEKVEKIPDASDSIFIGLFFSLIMGLVPPMFRTYNSKEFFNILSSDGFVSAVLSMAGNGWK